MLSDATREDWDVDQVLKAGERAWNLKRALNIRLGLTRATEKLPKLLLQALPDGVQEGHLPDKAVLIKEYYISSSRDEGNGKPMPEKLIELGLDFVLE